MLRSCLLGFMLLAMLLSVHGTAVAMARLGGQNESSATPAGQNSSRAQRDRLWAESSELEKAGKLAEAIRVVEQVLAIERTLYGAEALELADTYARLAHLHDHMERFDAAKVAAAESLRLKIKHLGEDHWQVVDARWMARDIETRQELAPNERREWSDADAAASRVASLIATRRYADAMAVMKDVPPVYRRILGAEHPLYGHSLFVLAHLFGFQGDYAQALPLYEEAREAQRKALGEDHPAYANNLSSLAFAYQMQREFTRAEPLYRQALKIKEKWLGAEHADFLMSLEVLAQLYQSTGRHGQARPLLEQVVAARKKTLGDTHVLYARGLNNLAQTCQALGDYTAAEQDFLRAMTILKASVGEQHSDYTAVLNNLAILYQYTGDYTRAAPLAEQVLQNYKKLFGDKHSKYAVGLHNLAFLYRLMGDHARAEALFVEAVQIYKHSLGTKHPDYATALHSLAGLYHTTGRHDRAKELYLEALQIRIDSGSTENLAYAMNVNDLALLYQAMGDRAKSEDLFLEALAVTERVVGKEHREYAVGLDNLAALYQLQEDYARAVPRCLEALELLKRTVGEGHVDYARALNRLSWLHAAQGDFGEALEHASTADRIQQSNLLRVLAGSSEHTMRTFLATQRDAASWLISLAQKTPDASQAAAAAYRAALGRKTAVFDAMLRLRQFERLGVENAAIRDQSRRLRELRQELANSALTPSDEAGAKDRQRVMREVDELETELNRTLQTTLGANRPLGFDTLNLDSLARKLPADAALIELVQYAPFDFQARGQEKLWQASHYAAFVLRGGEQTQLTLVDLGAAEPIDRLVDELREAVAATSQELALSTEADLEKDYREIAQRLSAAVVAPLQTAMGECDRLYIAPDGELARIPWEALLDDGEQYLVETRSISYLSAGTDLLRDAVRPATGSVVFAAPDYKLDGHPVEPSPEMIALLRGGTQTRIAGELPVAMRGLNWEPLPATEKEAERLGELLGDHAEYGPVVKLLGPAALEGALKRMGAPRLLHLATHGYYLPDQSQSEAEGADTFSLDPSGRMSAARGLAALRKFENPLLRSGIVLAGANRRRDEFADDLPDTSADDGWVTAEEIGLLDLTGTELVVLSACETGLGDLRTGEGVSGLRRAFVHAGARTLVTSLYKVPDEATQELMTEFYTGLVTNKSKHEALSDAERAVIAKRRQEHGGAHPFFWASFILVGDAD